MANIHGRQFEQVFKFPPKRSLTRKQIERAREINQLFDAMRDELGMGTQDVFRRCADKEHGEFIRSVFSVPAAVETFCREALRPESKERQRLAIVRHLEKSK